MGISKELYMQYSEQGYDHSEKFICSKCVSDSYLKKIIRTEGTEHKCNFCGKTAAKAASFDVVSSTVMGYIKDNYDRSIDTLYYGEDEPYEGKTVNTIDIIYNLAEFISDETEVLEELSNVIHNESYTCEFQMPSKLDEELWNSYCCLAKSRKESVETIVSLCKREEKPKDIEELTDILDGIISLSKSMKLTKYIGSKYPIYRAVNFHDLNALTPGFDKLVAAQIGTPPPMFCGENRFSEKGDMVFYGANNKEITKKEIGAKKDGKPYTIGTFYTGKRITIIDYSTIADWKRPSIFDLENKYTREVWFFLNMFSMLISQEIEDNKELYKPTQLLLKYIQRNTSYSGIAYRSSKSEYSGSNKDICYALFVTNRNCLDECERKTKENKDTLKLYMKSYSQE